MKGTLIVLGLLVASPVLANDVDPFGFETQPIVAGKSFSEARAEAVAAAKNGEIRYGEVVPVTSHPAAPKSRRQVRDELSSARASGETNYGPTYDPIAVAGRSGTQIQ